MSALNVETMERGAEAALAPLTGTWPRHEPDEIAAVAEVLGSGKVNALVHGTQTKAFAEEFAAYIGMPAGLCIANGTLTLEVALRALGVGRGDEVIVPARSFFATASCVLAVGALPVFADVDGDSQNIDPASVERLIGPRTRAVICVHLAGWPCDMDALVELCNSHRLHLVEDCAQAHGATWRGRKVGSFGAASSFSFCTDKIMSTGGEGGLLLLRDREAFELGWSIKDHGKSHVKVHGRAENGAFAAGEFRYIHDLAGSNYRMTEMQAAIGRRQLTKLPAWLAARRRNAAFLMEAWADLAQIRLPAVPDHAGSAWYKFYVQLTGDGSQVQDRRSVILEALAAHGIPAGSGSCPDMSREQALGSYPIRRDGILPSAVSLGRRTLMFPVDHTLEIAQMKQIALALREVLGA